MLKVTPGPSWRTWRSALRAAQAKGPGLRAGRFFNSGLEQAGELGCLRIDAVVRKYTQVCRFSHASEYNFRLVEANLHGLRKGFYVPSRDEPTILPCAYQFRNAPYERADDRTLERHRLHDDHR